MAQRTFLSQLKELQDKLEEVQPAVLKETASFLVYASPDDTGAYVLSHSIGRSGNVGRSISSKGRVSAPNTHRGEALNGLLSQIESIPKDSSRVFIGNNAPHVNAVEYGGPGWRRGGYFVYEQLRSVFPSIVKSAINAVGLK